MSGRMCAAQACLEPWGSVFCTKGKGHRGEHHAYDALIDHRWPSANGVDDEPPAAVGEGE